MKQAIDARNIISFDYKGHARVVEPYHYGKLYMTPQYKLIKKPQEDSLLCYQIEGTSNSNFPILSPLLKAARGPPTCVAIGVSNSVAGYRTFGAAGKEAIGDGQLWIEPPAALEHYPALELNSSSP